MKTLSFVVSFLVVVTALQARENPFMPTKTYEDEMQRMMEIEIDPAPEFQEKKESQYEYTMEKKPTPIAKTPEQIAAELKAKQRKEAQAKKAKELEAQKKALEKAKAEAKKNPLIYVKMRNDVIVDKKIDVLPFLNIEYTNTQLKIHSKYKVFKKFYLEDENKLILDFRGYTSFYTRHYDLEGNAFSKFSIGNHKEQRFFRVVIKLKEKSEHYEVTYDENMVLVTFNE